MLASIISQALTVYSRARTLYVTFEPCAVVSEGHAYKFPFDITDGEGLGSRLLWNKSLMLDRPDPLPRLAQRGDYARLLE